MIKKWLDKIWASQPILKSVKILKRYKPWGFGGLSFYFVMKFFLEGIVKGSLTTRAVAISYRLLLAVAPLLIVVLTILSWIHIDNFQENFLLQIQEVFPGDTYSQLVESSMNTLNELIFNKEENQNTIISIVGFVLMLYYASNSVNAILIGFNESYHFEYQGNWLIRRLVSMILLLVLGTFMVVAVLLIMFSGVIIDFLEQFKFISSGVFPWILNIARWLIAVFLIYTSITTLYNVGEMPRRKWRFVTVGATFATLFFIIGSIGFAYFINNLAQYSKLYGSLGTFMVLLIWLNFNFVILLLGYELNTSIGKAKSVFSLEQTIK